MVAAAAAKNAVVTAVEPENVHVSGVVVGVVQGQSLLS